MKVLETLCTVGGSVNGSATFTVENSVAVPQKLNMELPSNPVTSLLGIYPEELETESQRDIYTVFIAALFTAATTWKQLKCPSIDDG